MGFKFEPSIRNKLHEILFVQMVLLSIWFAYFLTASFNAYMEENKSAHNQLVAKIDERMTAVLGEMITASTFPVIRNADGTYSSIYRYFSMEKREQAQQRAVYRDASIRAREIMELYRHIDGVLLLDRQGEGMYTRKKRDYMDLTLSSDSVWLSEVLSRKGSWLVTRVDEGEAAALAVSTDAVCVTRSLINIAGYRHIGYVGTVSDMRGLYTEVLEEKHFEEMTFGTFDQEGNLFFGDLSTEDIAWLRAHDTGDAQSSFYAEGKLFCVRRDAETMVWAAICLPLAPLYQDFFARNFWLLLGLLVLLVLTGLRLSRLVHSVTQAVTTLSGACAQVAEGTLSARVPVDSHEELAHLASSFNHMADEIEYLINEVYKKELTARSLEVETLKSQINPHFLYNTLESIRMTAYAHGQYELAEMTTLLGKLFRYGISKVGDCVCLREELQYIEEYMRLKRLHSAAGISLEVHCEPCLEKCSIMKMLLQPLVENALMHGFDSNVPRGCIEIMAYRRNENLILSVSDNGCGMDTLRLEALVRNLGTGDSPDFGIGLRNTYRRICLLYGEGYGMEVRSVQGRGTVITLTLPVLRQEGDVEDGLSSFDC